MCLRIIIELHKQFRPSLTPEVRGGAYQGGRVLGSESIDLTLSDHEVFVVCEDSVRRTTKGHG